MDSESDEANERCGLLDLPWEDVLVSRVLCYLPLYQLVRLQRVSRGFHSLIQLYLVNCRTFDLSQSGDAVPKEAFCAMLRGNTVLHALSLHSCSGWLSDHELLPVIGQNHQLAHLDLRGCAGLSVRALGAVSLVCTRLRLLCLAHCEWVTDAALHALADHCPELRVLDVTACGQLRDEAVQYAVSRWPALRSISLALNGNISDAAVEEVAKRCRELEHLDLTSCLRVHDHAIRTVAEYCPKLQSLKVNHCHNVSECSLVLLRRRSVQIDVEPPLQRALVLLQDAGSFAPLINLQI